MFHCLPRSYPASILLVVCCVALFGLLPCAPASATEYAAAPMDDSYPDSSEQENNFQEPAYEEPAYNEAPEDQSGTNAQDHDDLRRQYDERPQMDPEQASHFKQVREMCQQYARESGLEGEDQAAYVDECVYSQTGF